MDAPARYEFEYAAFNEDPGKPIDYPNEFLFSHPIRIFSTGLTGKREAEQWVHERNVERQAARMAPHRNNLEVDAIAGKPVNLEVRKRLIVMLAWENADN